MHQTTVTVELLLRVWHERQHSRQPIDDVLRCPIVGSEGLKRKLDKTLTANRELGALMTYSAMAILCTPTYARLDL